MAEPSEDAISNFISFTSSTREQAITYLKSSDLDSNKAINAYFEGPPVGPQPQPPEYSEQNVPSIQYNASNAPASGVTAPSRPPSRINRPETRPDENRPSETPAQNTGGDQKLSLAEREQDDIQRAMAMSLNQNLGDQETGVTSTDEKSFGPATRGHYDEGDWSMTLFNSSSHEIIASPEPEDRKRGEGEPAFFRPSSDNAYMGGFLTILHSIPLAREALLLRSKVLSDYGHDWQWWNGQSINLPKIVTLQDGYHGDTDWDDILYETQRLVAFLDSTTRAFGSIDALIGLKALSAYDSAGDVGKFLEKWQEAAVRADLGNQLAAIFSSNAFSRSIPDSETPIETEFTALMPQVEPQHGQTLYDVLDQAMWPDRPGEGLDDVWLEHVAEVLTIKLDGPVSAKSVDVKIPAVFYPDRYLAGCRELARNVRSERLKIMEEISKIDTLMSRFTVPQCLAGKGLTSRETLEKAADAVPLLLPKSVAAGANQSLMSAEAANSDAQRLANELKAISNKIGDKLQELENRKQKAVETLRSQSKFFESSQSSTESPHHQYMLRGVCTEPHITYVLRPRVTDESTDEWQWWRISFSLEDAKTRQAERHARGEIGAPKTDAIGYTARKVREIEVLHAAREESRSALLVYASSNAMGFSQDAIPPQLQTFVDMDNQAFEEEFQDARRPEDETGAQTGGWQANENPRWNDQDGPPSYESVQEIQGQPPEKSQASKVDVFDYEVQSFDGEKAPVQEMQQRNSQSLLYGRRPSQPSSVMDTSWDDVEDRDKMHEA